METVGSNVFFLPNTQVMNKPGSHGVCLSLVPVHVLQHHDPLTMCTQTVVKHSTHCDKWISHRGQTDCYAPSSAPTSYFSSFYPLLLSLLFIPFHFHFTSLITAITAMWPNPQFAQLTCKPKIVEKIVYFFNYLCQLFDQFINEILNL